MTVLQIRKVNETVRDKSAKASASKAERCFFSSGTFTDFSMEENAQAINS
jgi:hypothetical protein